MNEISRTAWPSTESTPTERDRPRIGVVTVNFNTRLLIAQLIFSLYRLLGRAEFAQLVVVDNASTDGSAELLQALHDANLIHLIQNQGQRYHGPALTQGVSWLAERQGLAGPSEQLDYVWLLDSDVVVLRSDTVSDVLAKFDASDAAAVGLKVADPVYDRLLRYSPRTLHPSSLMFDPARIWRPPIPPFVEGGAPAVALQVAADAQGLRLAEFPFVEEGYLIHLGRGTLRQVADLADTTNRYYKWASRHREYHFAGEPKAEEAYDRFGELFEADVGDLSADRLVKACQESGTLTID